MYKRQVQDTPLLIHVITQKGHGYDLAERQPEKFHGVAPFRVENGMKRSQSSKESAAQAAGKELVNMAAEDARVVAVTAVSYTQLVDYGMPIQKVGRSAQENVRKSIESMTGLHVEKVDLHVVGVSFEKENEELQQSQKIAMSLEEEEEQHALEEGTVAQEVPAPAHEEAEEEAATSEAGEEAEQEEESSEQE